MKARRNRGEVPVAMLGTMPYQRPEDDRDVRMLRRFGLELRRCRIYAGLSQVELSARSGVSQSTISRLENGKASSAAMFKIVLIGDAMGRGLPLAFCPHDHHCTWPRLNENGTPSRDGTRPVADDFLDAFVHRNRADG
jgi:transcriptional regulator with XRE-family HTH domain